MTVSAYIYSSKDGGLTSVFGNTLSEGDGEDRSAYIFATSVVPKSRLEPVSCTLLKASRNIALCASSRFKKKINGFFYLFIADLTIQILVNHLRALLRGNIRQKICA